MCAALRKIALFCKYFFDSLRISVTVKIVRLPITGFGPFVSGIHLDQWSG